jgi:hypothetical protein
LPLNRAQLSKSLTQKSSTSFDNNNHATHAVPTVAIEMVEPSSSLEDVIDSVQDDLRSIPDELQSVQEPDSVSVVSVPSPPHVLVVAADAKNPQEEENQQSHEIYVSNREENKKQKIPWLDPNYNWHGIHPFKYFTFIKKRKYPDNAVRTTIYKWWNFFILNLILQYTTKLSNIYFTVVMIFTLIPSVSPVFPITSIIPVVFIIGVNMLKDGFEDLVSCFFPTINIE